MVWLYLVVLILLVLRFELSDYRDGYLEVAEVAVLVPLILAMVSISFFAWGWRFGAGALIGVIALGAVLKPVGAAIVRRPNFMTMTQLATLGALIALPIAWIIR